MRIGFDISQTGTHKTGCGYFSHALINSLTELDQTNSYSLYSAFGTAYWDRFHWWTTRKAKKNNARRINLALTYGQLCDLWNNSDKQIRSRLGHPDIIHCNSYFCAKPLKGTRIVYTLYDLSFMEHPEYATELTRCKCFEGVFNAALNADMIVAISQFTRDRFLQNFPFFPKERIKVVYPASRFKNNCLDHISEDTPLKKIEPGKFWLFVGTIEPRKNLRRLLKAYAIAKHKHGIAYPLVVVGGKGWKEEGLDDYINRLDIGEYVIKTGYVSDNQLIWFYRHCYAFLYPSLYEGFGLPVVEAMGFGAAVITSQISSIPEVGANAVVYVNPHKEDEIIKAMLDISDNTFRQALKKKTKVQANKFDWDQSAEKMLDLYQYTIQCPPLSSL